MIHHITPNYMSSALPNLLTKSITRATSSTSTGSSSGTSSSSATNSSTSADGDIGSTFLSLLTQELQNQDPTDPIDSTAMVGQMISLNQLDQLISINQVLGGNPGSLTGASSTSTAGAASKQNTVSSANQLPISAPQLPFNPSLTTSAQPSFS